MCHTSIDRITINRDYLITTLTDLVRIDSTNPLCMPGGAGEAQIAAYIAGALDALGFRADMHEIQPGRVNVVGTLPGTGNGRSLLLHAHTDTVGVIGMDDPFSAHIDRGRLYGRGAQDIKSGMAAILAAVKALVDAGIVPGGDVIVAGAADEEYTSIGTEALVKQLDASGTAVDGAIVTEPTGLALGLAHRCFTWYEVETIGRAAHGSRYDLGIDANMRMGRFLAKLDILEQALRARDPHPLVGPPSLHAALLQGGTEPSIYADRCELRIERRTLPGETEAQTTAELQAIVDALSVQDATFRANVKPLLQRLPFEIDAGAPIVKTVDRAAARQLDQPAVYVGLPFWTDAALIAAAGVETVVIGPAGQGLHQPEEWVDIQSVVDLAHILAESIVCYCA